MITTQNIPEGLSPVMSSQRLEKDEIIALILREKIGYGFSEFRKLSLEIKRDCTVLRAGSRTSRLIQS
jgi:hypothetical protein